MRKKYNYFDETEHLREQDENFVEDSLEEIYHDDRGHKVNLNNIDHKKSKRFIWRFLFFVIAACCVALAGWKFGLPAWKNSTAGNFDFYFETQDANLTNGQDIEVLLHYKNLNKSALKTVKVKVDLPGGFVFTESAPMPDQAIDPSSVSNTRFYSLGRIEPYGFGQIKIKGKIFGRAEDKSKFAAEITYMPENFSSEFKQSAEKDISVIDPGFEAQILSPSAVIIGDKKELVASIKPDEKINFDKLEMELSANSQAIEFLKKDGTPANAKQSETNLKLWTISIAEKDEIKINIPFQVKEELDNLSITASFYYPKENGERILVLEKKAALESVKNDLNLVMSVNGSSGGGINPGGTLEFVIAYANKGAETINDVTIAASISGDLVDWSSLRDEHGGTRGSNSIIWTKDDIPGLAAIEPDKEGEIKFSVKTFDKDLESFKSEEIKGYAQFSLSGDSGSDDTKSNEVLLKLNSPIKFNEKVLYFNDEIIPGEGPLPPKVGQKTIVRAYWTLGGNIHELNNIIVEATLPNYVSWEGKESASAGAVSYDPNTRKVFWQISRLPVFGEDQNSEFSISVTPSPYDQNKILILIPEARVKATDVDTSSEISATVSARTTKLEDDNVAQLNNNGLVTQ